jgi:Zn-dependent protease with chaperone function
MILALFLVGLLLLWFPGLAASRSRRFPAHEWASVAFLSVVVGSVALVVGLVLTAEPLMQSALTSSEIDYCRDALAPFAGGSAVLSLLASGAAIVVTTRMISTAVRSRRATRHARIEPWLGEHSERQGFELVVVPTEALLAYGVPGADPQVVLSEGLRATLTPRELDAVLAHEAAHLRLHHPKMLTLLSCIESGFGGVPLVRGSITQVRSALEFWADAAAEAEYTVTIHTLCAALVGVTASAPAATPTMPAAARDRMHRLRRRPAPRPALVRALLYAPVALLTLVVATSALGWFTDAHHALALGAPCH